MREQTKRRWSVREWADRISSGGHSTSPARKEEPGGKPTGKPKEKLSRQALLLLAVNGLFAAANALSGTFVNVYIWKIKNDFTLIGWFAVMHQVTMALTFWLAGKWVKEHNKMNALRVGVAFSALFYGLVLLLGTQAASYIPLIGFVQGISSGLFWLSFNVVYFEVTDPGNRDRFNGWAGLLGSFAGMIAPWVSGLVITRMEDTSGYRLIFSVSLGVFILGAVLSFFLHKRKAQGKYDWLGGFRSLREPGSPWKTVSLAMIAQGLREGIFGFMIALLVYISTQNEMKLGSFSLVTSAVALCSFWFVGRLLKPRYRKWGMFVGAVMMSAVILPLFWQVNYGTLLAFGIGTALFFPLYTIPGVSIVFDIIGQTDESAKQRVEFVVFRELCLNTGRFIGTIAFIIVISRSTAPLVVNTLLLIFGSSPILVWWLMRGRLEQEINRSPKPAV
ncbi:MFS transporter [Paenibacillus sp. MBLB4367]|uniref:MFS transporter n=1 Tax=Paenibacillus sp. MBLB4367 TaxID=3384767 RepID=UPI0039083783